MTVYFEREKWVSGGKTRGDVRRLGTASWGENKDKKFSTQWLWFFKNDKNEWQELANAHDIEQAFVAGNAEFEFARGRSKFKYKVDFHREINSFTLPSNDVILYRKLNLVVVMINVAVNKQENVSTGKLRDLRRRPK